MTTVVPHNGAGVAHAGQIRQPASSLRACHADGPLRRHALLDAISTPVCVGLDSLCTPRPLCVLPPPCCPRCPRRDSFGPRWPTIGHCLVTCRRRPHNAAHHVDGEHQNTFQLRTQGALAAEIGGSSRLPRPRCAPAPPRVARMRRPAPTHAPLADGHGFAAQFANRAFGSLCSTVRPGGLVLQQRFQGRDDVVDVGFGQAVVGRAAGGNVEDREHTLGLTKNPRPRPPRISWPAGWRRPWRVSALRRTGRSRAYPAGRRTTGGSPCRASRGRRSSARISRT